LRKQITHSYVCTLDPRKSSSKKRKEKLVDSTANPPYLPGRSSEKTYISHFDHGRSKIRAESCTVPAVFRDNAVRGASIEKDLI
jgi:hypothetical protein